MHRGIALRLGWPRSAARNQIVTFATTAINDARCAIERDKPLQPSNSDELAAVATWPREVALPAFFVTATGKVPPAELNRPGERAHLRSWEGWHDMAKTQNYSEETRQKAIRLVREHAGDYPSEYAAITAVAGRLGMTAETLRKWIRQAEVDGGKAPGVTTEEAAQVRQLRRKVAELERTIEIL